MNPFVRRLVQLLPNQYNQKAIQVDDQLRVKGAPLGTVYALGDAATVRGTPCRFQNAAVSLTPLSTQIETNLVDHLMDIFEDADTDKNSRL
jgi:NADH dehydrogenase